MASMKFSLVLLLACTLSLQGVLADIICENLSANVCAFSVSSFAKRCVLENSIKDGGKVEYQCKTSEVVVGSSVAEYLETDECVKACGIDRKSVGMSSDALLEPTFTAKLCSPACYNNCPNIIDLYFNLASGEGVYLPDMCSKRRSSLEIQSDSAVAPAIDAPTRRAMVELLSSGAIAPAVDAPARRSMVELLSSGAVAPAVDAPAPAVDAPTQPRYSRRAMVELLSSASVAPVADDPALGPISSDDLVSDTPAPSLSYF